MKRPATKLNCWEVTRCGREPGGSRAEESGVCPAATAVGVDGIHGGTNGGRACWAVPGTLCDGEIQRDVFAKIDCCANCEFFLRVMDEEDALVLVPDIVRRVGPQAASGADGGSLPRPVNHRTAN